MPSPLVPISFLLRTLPVTVHSAFLSRLFNHLLQGQYMAEQLQDLDGKRLAITISDTNTQLLFQIKARHLIRAPLHMGGKRWDVRIKGTLESFWLLATRSEDPDTLFFNRSLAIEGETETGLYLKNMLDSLDFDWLAHLEAVLGPRVASLVMRTAQRTGLEQRIKRLPTLPITF